MQGSEAYYIRALNLKVFHQINFQWVLKSKGKLLLI